MKPKYIETNSKLQYGIPGLFELQERFEAQSSTGTTSAYAQIESIREYLNKNVTLRNENLSDPTLYYYYIHQAPGLSEKLNQLLLWSPYTFVNIVSEARKLVNSLENKTMALEANTILDLIQEQLVFYNSWELPHITAFQLENGSLGFEWIVGHFRVGFNFEIDAKESGYFLISDRSAGEIRNYGYLQSLNKRTLIKSLLILVLGK